MSIWFVFQFCLALSTHMFCIFSLVFTVRVEKNSVLIPNRCTLSNAHVDEICRVVHVFQVES